MGFPLGPPIINVFMCHFENIWLVNFFPHFKPIAYARFVDDTFLLFRTKNHTLKHKIYVGNWGKWFAIISGYNNQRESNKIMTSVYPKPVYI